jgi:ankyrin repeat protein
MLSNRFRWVYCKLDVLRQCHRNDLRRIIKELPQSLDETYRRILKEINGANPKQAHRLLQCLVAAHRPLRVEELAEVLALDVDAGGIPRFNAEWRLEDHEAAVLSTCSSLVSVVDHDGSRVVQFCHFSVKQFLMSDRLSSTEDISQFRVAHEPSHVILAQACLAVFLSVDDATSEGSAGDIPLSGYAYEHWLGHAQVGNVELQIKGALDRFFDLDKPHLAAFFRSSRARASFKLRFFSSSDEESKSVLSPAAPFYFAATSGLSGLAERLMVAKKPQVINFCGYKGTLLHLAVREGHIDVVRLLLAHGADLNSRKDYATPPRIVSRIGRPLDNGLDTIDDIENALPDTGVDVSSKESSDVDGDPRRESGFTPLHLAASEGHLDICRMLLERNADVHVHDGNGDTPLHLAASSRHLEIACILLKYNAEVNSRNKDGSTPLFIASSKGNLDIFRLLLAHNADAFVHDNRGSTPLHLAAMRGHLEVSHSLIELKADINALDDEGLAPLQRASQGRHERHWDIIQLLLDHGANLNACDKSGNTALHFAASEGHLEAARMLLERGADVNSQNDEGLAPLQRASQGQHEGHRDIIRLLLDHGADLGARDNSGNSALHFAAFEGHFEVAHLLLERGADVNSQNGEGLAPLQRASQGRHEGYLEVVRLLLDHGANVNMHDNSGNTALHFVASGGHLEVARMLIEQGAEVNSQNDKGLLASQDGYEDIVRLLLDRGANVDMHDIGGNTALHFAAYRGHLEVARMLLERNAEVKSQNDAGATAFLLALMRRHTGQNIAVVQLLLGHNVDVHAHDKHGNTPLHVAACNGDLDVCRILLKRNVAVNSQNSHGSTPLLLASEFGPPDLVQLFLDHNADVYVCDSDGDTVLHRTVLAGQLEVSMLLLNLDVEVNSRNSKGSTPLHLASVGYTAGNLNIVQLLLDHGADAQARNLSGKTASEVARGPNEQEIVRLLSQHTAG